MLMALLLHKCTQARTHIHEGLGTRRGVSTAQHRLLGIVSRGP
jgi:hypothetical protein